MVFYLRLENQTNQEVRLMLKAPRCCRCGIEIAEIGIIYIRAQKDDKWGSHPICTMCWFAENPDREPVRLMRERFDKSYN